MVLGIYLVIAALSAVGICLNADGFASLRWLWLLPASFAGVFLALVLLTFLLMLVMNACVRMDKTQEKDSKFYRGMAMWAIRLVIPLLGIRVHEKGVEKVPEEGRFMLVCNHLANIDPAFLLRALPKRTLAFISKREVDQMFLVGRFLHKMLGQPVNRENDREALKTILNCIRLIQEDKASVAAFPEGYVSDDKLLHPFRRGVFKIAQRTKIPVVVCTLRNTHKAIPNALRLRRTDIDLHVVGVIPAEEIAGMSTAQIGDRVYAMMAEDLGPDLVLQT